MGHGTKLRLRLWNGGQTDCYYCCRPMIAPERFGRTPRSPLSATIDHHHPFCRGGRIEDNAVLACRDCNELKGDLTAAEFEAAILWAVENVIELERRGSHYPALRHQSRFREFFREKYWPPALLSLRQPLA